MASTKDQQQIQTTTIRATESKMDNETRASRGGNACLERHGTDFFRSIAQQRWANAEAK